MEEPTLDGLTEFEPTEPETLAVSSIAQHRIVGLGVAARGARQLQQCRSQLLRELLTTHDVGTVALEAGFGSLLPDSTPREPLDPTAVRASLPRYWQSGPVIELLDWLSSFNDERPPVERVRLFGLSARHTQGAVDRLMAYFEEVDPPFLETVRYNLGVVADGQTVAVGEERKRQIREADRLIETLFERLSDCRTAYIKQAGKDAWDRARQCVSTVEQAVARQRPLHQQAVGELEEQTAIERSIQLEQFAMADTLDWILDYTDAETVVVLAHDSTLARIEQIDRSDRMAIDSLGVQLASRYGDSYYALGSGMGRGRVALPSSGESGESTERIRSPTTAAAGPVLDQSDSPAVFFDLDAVEQSPEWLPRIPTHSSLRTDFTGTPTWQVTVPPDRSDDQSSGNRTRPDTAGDPLYAQESESSYVDSFDGLLIARRVSPAQFSAVPEQS